MIKTRAIKLGVSLATVLGMAACTADTQAPSDPSDQDTDADESELKQWKRGAWELKLSTGPSQFSPFRTLLKSADVVGIGESIHMTGTQHALRVDAMKYMIERLQFRVIGIETGYLSSRPLAAYLAGEHDSLDEAMASVIGAFTSVEDGEFYKWVKDWNQTHPSDRVVAFGFDVQDLETVAYLRQQNKSLGFSQAPQFTSCFCAQSKSLQACANSVDRSIAYGQAAFEGPRYDSCIADIQKESNLLTQADFSAKSAGVRQSIQEAKVVLAMLRGYTNMLHEQVVNESESHRFRDEAMADIAVQKVNAFGKKTIFVAHNGHLDKSNTSLLQQRLGSKLPMFGGFVRQRLGSRYKTVGQFSFNTEVNWPGGMPSPAPHNRTGAYEKMLKQTDKDYLLLDNSDNALFGKGDSFFMEDRSNAARSIPSEHYDLTLYSETSVGMKYYGAP